jgi:hypothetical protein
VVVREGDVDRVRCRTVADTATVSVRAAVGDKYSELTEIVAA